MLSIYLPALIVAFVVTALELTEVVVLVFAISADQASVTHGALGAATGAGVVAAAAVGFGAALLAFPRTYLLWASATVLAAFGVFLFRSTIRSYRRREEALRGVGAPPTPARRAVQFAGGFSVGAIETTEAVVVLLALAAAGYGGTAVVGALAAAVVLIAATSLVHERVRRFKVPLLKLGATSLLFSFALFWGGEAAHIPWPGADLILVAFFAAGLLIVRGAVELALRTTRSTPLGSGPKPG